MKNQYVGDVGDYGKYGLLRFLIQKEIKVGVNWYLTENDETNDGQITGYLNQNKDRIYDAELFGFLKEIAKHPDKSVQMIEMGQVLNGTVFYHRIIDRKSRQEWHQTAMEILSSAELVFCDPDNGPIGTKKLSEKDSEKYITPQEIVDYYRRGQNIMYYCQKARRTPEAWEATKNEMKKYLPEAELYTLTYHRGTQRSYVFVVHPEDSQKYSETLSEFQNHTDWGRNKLFTTENHMQPTSVQENSSIKAVSGSLNIKLLSGERYTIMSSSDGWLEIISNTNPERKIRRRPEDFINRLYSNLDS